MSAGPDTALEQSASPPPEVVPAPVFPVPTAGSRSLRQRLLSLAGGLLAVVDQAVVSGTSFVTSVAVGRICSREELGTYALALSVALFLRGVQGELALSPFMIYSGRRQGQGLATYTGSVLVHYLGLTLLSTTGLAGLALVFSLGFGPAGLAPAVWALAGVLPLLLLREYARQVSLAQLRMGVVLTVDLGVAALQLGGLFLLAHLDRLTVPAVYAVMGSACALAFVAWVLTARPPLAFDRLRLAADWHHNWAFGRWALSGFLVGSTTPYVMPWIVALSHGEAATGLLAACTTIINCAGMYVTGVSNLLTPRAARAYARGGRGELLRVLRGTALLFLLTLGAFCLVIVVAGDLPATLIYGGKYAGTGTILALLALAMLANSLGVTAGNGLWALEQPRANFAADVCTAGVTATAAVMLVPPLGVLGAAGATLAGSLSGATVRGIQLTRWLGARRPGGAA